MLRREAELLDEVAARLIEDRLTPVDIERARLRGIHEVVPEGPGDQDVRIGERDRQAQSMFPYAFASGLSMRRDYVCGLMLARIWSGVLVQMNGCLRVFQPLMKVRILVVRSRA